MSCHRSEAPRGFLWLMVKDRASRLMGNGSSYWSSEGRNGGHVYILPSGGGTPKQISAALAWAGLALIWSPTSKYVLAYGGAQRQPHFQEHPDWWVIPIDGGRPIRTGAQRVFEQQGFKLNIFDTPPYPTDWIGNEILFSAKRGDTSDLWRVPIHSGTWQITGAGKRLTSVTGEIVAASITSGGEVVFANISTQIHLWSLPVDANRGTFSGGPAQLTESASSEYWPSVSGDGRRVVFTSVRTGRESTWLKDLVSGAESQLPIIGKLDEFPKLSPDGKRVAFTVTPEGRDGKPTIQILSLETMSTQEVLQDGDWVWTWSPDSRYLLCKAGALRYIRIVAVNSGRSVDILRDSAHNMYQASFSGDGRWLTFQHDSGLFVARYKGPVSIPKAEWIRITDGSHFDDKPRFSPDGNRLYFTSDRDGFWCLWTQRLDRETKKPVDEPRPVHHMHFGRRSLSNVGAPLADIAITQDRIIFPQRELTGNIWMLSSDSAN